MTTITLQTVPSGDLLTLAALPKPTMIPSVSKRAGIDPITRAVVAASIPRPRRIARRALPTIDLTPRSARSHLGSGRSILMTTLIAPRTDLAPARFSADHNDRFLADGTVVLADVPGAEPEVGDLVVVRRPGTVRGRVAQGTPRTYRVERVETREASVFHNGTHIVRDVTTAHLRFVPAVRP